jgi:fibro-slime domain-containing protein
MSVRIFTVLAVASLGACAEPEQTLPAPGQIPGDGGSAEGGAQGSQGGSVSYDPGGGGSPPACHEIQVGSAQLNGVLRDFTDAHPDFEGPLEKMGFDPGIVTPELGVDGLPIYASGSTTATTNGALAFAQWFRDIPGVNQAIPFGVTLVEGTDGVHRFDDTDFFPADGLGFGNQGRAHNYHFTVELHTQFLYEGGEVFAFRGDDDLFVFINGRQAIDIGGVHTPLEASVDLNAAATELGIVPGNVYPLDFFFAERHTSLSEFHIETTIGFVECPDPDAPPPTK